MREKIIGSLSWQVPSSNEKGILVSPVAVNHLLYLSTKSESAICEYSLETNKLFQDAKEKLEMTSKSEANVFSISDLWIVVFNLTHLMKIFADFHKLLRLSLK